MNSYDIIVKNNTDTGNVKIRIFTHDIISNNELKNMKVMQLSKVQNVVRIKYKGNVIVLNQGIL